MARVFIAGKEYEVPTDSQGRIDVEQLRSVVGVPEERALIHQKPSGENVVVRRRGQVKIGPYDHFMDAPVSRRG